MRRNMLPFYYALYVDKTPILDEYGNESGQYDPIYGNPVATKGNVSAARGETAVQQFGKDENYDKVIVLENPQTPIDEYSVLWVDTVPKLAEDGSLERSENDEIVTPWDYTVKKVARSLNSVSIAISKVNVGG